MKVWIDKQGGMHYHKKNCLALTNKSLFELTIGKDIPERGLDIYPWGITYSPCPICFGDKRK